MLEQKGPVTQTATVKGLFKNQIIHQKGGGGSVVGVKIALDMGVGNRTHV